MGPTSKEIMSMLPATMELLRAELARRGSTDQAAREAVRAMERAGMVRIERTSKVGGSRVMATGRDADWSGALAALPATITEYMSRRDLPRHAAGAELWLLEADGLAVLRYEMTGAAPRHVYEPAVAAPVEPAPPDVEPDDDTEDHDEYADLAFRLRALELSAQVRAADVARLAERVADLRAAVGRTDRALTMEWSLLACVVALAVLFQIIEAVLL